jgi:pyridoxal phosphate-dependent aminotransferase EpsN
MSNLLAAVGRGQLEQLDDRVAQRRALFARYYETLSDLPGIEFMPEASYGDSTRWLTCLTIIPEEFGASREDVRLALEHSNVESRPVWKPMHLQSVYRDCEIRGGGVSEGLFERGLCLPSGPTMTDEDVERVVNVIRSVANKTTTKISRGAFYS